MRHHTNELSFERPDWLFDRTHHVFTVEKDGPSPFTIVVSNTQVQDETLDEMVERILHDLGRTLDGFELGSRETATVAGEPAAIVQFRWRQDGRQLFQRQAALIHDGPDGRRLFQIAATATGEARPMHVAAFTELLQSLKFREPEAG